MVGGFSRISWGFLRMHGRFLNMSGGFSRMPEILEKWHRSTSLVRLTQKEDTSSHTVGSMTSKEATREASTHSLCCHSDCGCHAPRRLERHRRGRLLA